MDAGANVDAVAGMEAHLLWCDIPQGVVERLDAYLSPLATLAGLASGCAT
jgi:hypothetical protein